jgi:hypothetical protein
MKYNHENRKELNETRLTKLCREARARVGSNDENDLLWSLIVRIREDLEVGAGGGLLPGGSTRQETLWNNIFHHFNHQYDWSLSLNLTGTINRELLGKPDELQEGS